MGEMSHPTDRIKGVKGDLLKGRTIVLAITGSIAAVRMVELARDLIRRGADVHTVMSPASCRIIHPDAMEYATGNPVITELTGGVEHVKFCGYDGEADLLLVAPSTANTIGKMANGIDDTPVTTFATTAIGSGVPVMVVPAMHEAMYEHPGVRGNIGRLTEMGVEFVEPLFEEGKAKIAPNEEIILRVERMLGGWELRGKKVLITSGATSESIDPIRILTNRSSGRTGIELAKEAYRRGADVTIIHRTRKGLFYVREIFAESAAQMVDAAHAELDAGCDVFICAAAISDYTVDKESKKIQSGASDLILQLLPAPKLIKNIKDVYPNLFVVGFKAETNISADELIGCARNAMEASNLDLMVANDVGCGGIGEETNDVHIIDSSNNISRISGPKVLIAAAIIDDIVELMKK